MSAPFFALLVIFLLPKYNHAKTRTYYLKAVEIEWDYAPTGENHGQREGEVSDVHFHTSVDPPRIGRHYKKAVFRGYTDATYSQAEARPSWLGILGPIIKAEEGDNVIIHFWNNASRPYSVHPHGVFYNKAHEGALYSDSTNGSLKMDDGVPPGGRYVYNWSVNDLYRPTNDDPACVTYPYHSHIHTHKDINTGLVGAVLICKEGILDEEGKRTDVDHEYVLLFTIFDENLNYYLPETMEKVLNQSLTEELEGNEEFQESNKKHSINGLIYGNLQGLDFCVGDRISWHLFAMGSEPDLHSILFQGQTMIHFTHRRNTLSLFPAESTTALMVVNENTGKWYLSCQVFDHIEGGMDAVFNVRRCNNSTPTPETSLQVKEYFIKVEEIFWDYGPTGINQFSGISLLEDDDSKVFFEKSPERIGGIYKKAVFVGFSDATFQQPLTKDSSLGILGPVIRAEEGDTIRVTFLNNASRSYSIQPMSVIDTNGLEDKHFQAVPPGGRFTYEWSVPLSVSPTDKDSNCISGMYFSSVDIIRDIHSGLVGPMLLCKKKQQGTTENPSPTKELFLYYSVMNENLSHYLKENLALFCSSNSINEQDEDFQESNKMHAINGRMFGNLDGLNVCLNDQVTWYLMSAGDILDLHTAYFYGNTFTNQNNRRDSVPVISQTYKTLLMKPDNPGKWQLGCLTNDHHLGGMKAFYTVNECQQTTVSQEENQDTKTVRVYFIAAVERQWDFAPNNYHVITDEKLSENDESKVFYVHDDTHIGHIYKKALFREFTDSTFQHEKPHASHLAMLGPFIKAEVGDEIQVVFKNLASREYSLHPHGVLYSNSVEDEKSVLPNMTHTFTWKVPERSGPTKDDPACIAWAYYSDVEVVRDTNSGLVGPIVICRKGNLRSNGSRSDVDREFALLFSIIDENQSWYLDDNIQKYIPNPETIDKEDEDFKESNKMHAINGKIYDNLKGLEMKLGEKIAYYLIGMGSENDLHTIHWHGHTVLHRQYGNHRKDVIELFPGHVQTVEMLASNNGTWLLHCHVNDHHSAGMVTTFTVNP